MAISPIEIEKFLKGMNYPANKGDIIAKARENDASEEVISALEKMPDREYESPADVNRALGEAQ